MNKLLQDLTDPLLITALALAAIHFGVPLGYYWWAKTKWLPKPWNMKTDPSYRPGVAA